MKIAFEGPKGTGKTTAINSIVKSLNEDYKVIHMTKEDDNSFFGYKRLLDDENVIFDRYALGELVYPFIYKRVPQMGPMEVLALAKDVDYLFISYSSDPVLLIDRVLDRDSEIEEGIIESNLQFQALAEMLQYKEPNIILVDVAKESLTEVAEEILGWN